MRMHNPPHPGEIIRDLCLAPLGLSIDEAAKGLGVSPADFAALIDGQSRVSADMAIRLSKGFGASPESWLKHQLEYDLWQIKKIENQIKVKVFYDPAKQEPIHR